MTQFNEKLINDYVNYVSDMINKFKIVGDLINKESETVTPEKLNTALSYYFNVSLALNAEYQREKIKYLTMKQEFEVYSDELFEKAKSGVLAEYGENSRIKPSVKEFETRARGIDKKEYLKKEMELNEQEAKMRFLLRMQESMKDYSSILTTLANNMRQEMRSLNIDSRMKDEKIRSVGFPEKKDRVFVDED